MMKRVFQIVLLLGLAAAGFWLWTVFFPNPQQVIRKRLDTLARLASFSPGEGNIRRAANIQRLGTLFDENVQIMVDVPGVEPHTFGNREELMQMAMAANRLTKGVKAQFLDMNIDMQPDGNSAMVDLTLKAKVSGENDLIIQELNFTFKKMKDDWLITKIETVKTLKQ